ncbi:MAG: DUF5668 domain-containing protein [Bacteroidales bacterium]
MNSNNQNRTLGLGLIIILIGLAFLLNRLNLFSHKTEDIIFSWQMLVITIGVFNLFFTQSRTFGFIAIIVGGFFLLPEIFIFPFGFERSFWPVLLILLGIFIIVRARIPSKRSGSFKFEANDIHESFDEVNIFSGSEKKFSIESFKGGKITSIFGGSEIDLRNARITGDFAVIEVFYMFGGSTLTVPHDWVVINNVTAILGGFSDKRHNPPYETGAKKLIINGLVMFGGGEIKS